MARISRTTKKFPVSELLGLRNQKQTHNSLDSCIAVKVSFAGISVHRSDVIIYVIRCYRKPTRRFSDRSLRRIQIDRQMPAEEKQSKEIVPEASAEKVKKKKNHRQKLFLPMGNHQKKLSGRQQTKSSTSSVFVGSPAGLSDIQFSHIVDRGREPGDSEALPGDWTAIDRDCQTIAQ
jgi:hypothetical protein